MNDLIKAGVYQCVNGAAAATYSNKPSAVNSAFYLEVVAANEYVSGEYFRGLQRLTDYGFHAYMRVKIGNNWSAWKEFQLV